MSLGVAIGALTFTGSVIAFLKLSGRMSGAPIILPGRHFINIALACALVFFIYGFYDSQSHIDFWTVTASRSRLAFSSSSRSAARTCRRDLDAELVFGLGGGGHRFHARQHRIDRHRCAGGVRAVRSSRTSCARAMNRSFISVILGGFGGETAGPAGKVETRPVKRGSADDAAFIMKNAEKVIIVPGYGMAVAQGAARPPRDGRQAEGRGRRSEIRDPSGRGPHAGPHERAARGSECALRRSVRA